ncbi:MAG: hypothetical protein V4589_05580 [Bacteroidota bacterium]
MDIYGNTIDQNHVSSSSTSSVDLDVAVFDSTTGVIIKDSGVQIGTISGGPYVPLNGSASMTGDLNLGTHAISGITNLNGTALTNFVTNTGTGPSGNLPSFVTNKVIQNSTIVAADVITNSGSATVGRVATFSGNKTIQDGGTLLSDLATTASVSSTYMPKSGGAFTGAVDMGTQTLTVNNMSDNGTNGMHWGAGSAASNVDALVIGRGSSTATDSVVIGRNSGSAGTYGVILGVNSSSGNNTPGNVAVGAFCNASGDTTPFSGGGGAIAIGFTVDATNKEAIAIGSGLNNSTASSLLIGGTAPMVNWRPLTDNTCDLGVASTNTFKDIHAKGSLAGGTNSRTVDNIVSNAGSGTAGNVCTFASNKVIQDGAVALSSLATTSAMTTADNLRVLKAGDTMSGNLAMGGNSITGFGTLAPTATNIQIGNSTANLLLRTVQISNQNLTGSANDTVVVGYDAVGVGCQRSVIVGPNASVSGINSVAVGYQATSNNQTSNIVVGQGSSITSTAASTLVIGSASTSSVSGGHCIGGGLTNTTANSILVQGGTNIRNNVDAACDLGTTALRFKDEYLSGALYVGTTSATGKVVVSGGPANGVAGEETGIRAISSSTATKIELQNTAASGHLFELRSNNAGNFQITDRTSAVTRFQTLGSHFGFNATPFASGSGCLYLGSGSVPAFNPTSGGCFCTQNGDLFWMSQGGKITQLATNV